MESNYSTLQAGSINFVVCAREGGASTTPFSSPVFPAAHFAKQKTKSGGGESQGGAGIPFPPSPFPSRSAREIRVLGSVRRLRRRFKSFSFQKWFELRLEFATILDFRNFGGFGFANFSRSLFLRSLSCQLKFDIPQANPKRLFWRGGGGSELRINSPRICGVSNFFLSAESGISQSFNPRFTSPPMAECQRRQIITI